MQAEFKSIQAKKMPALICTGIITEVGDTYVSKSSGQYLVTPVTIEAEGAGRNTKLYLLTRPEWFQRSFDPNTIVDEYGSGVDFVYRKHFNNDGEAKRSFTFLHGVLGGTANYVAFRNAMNLADGENLDTEQLTASIRQYAAGTRVGYVLLQESEKVETVGENGEQEVTYVRTDRYKLDRMFDPTDAELKRLRNQAERSNGNTQFTVDVPF